MPVLYVKDPSQLPGEPSIDAIEVECIGAGMLRILTDKEG